jgi:hypothetical protein
MVVLHIYILTSFVYNLCPTFSCDKWLHSLCSLISNGYKHDEDDKVLHTRLHFFDRFDLRLVVDQTHCVFWTLFLLSLSASSQNTIMHSSGTLLIEGSHILEICNQKNPSDKCSNDGQVDNRGCLVVIFMKF